VQIAGILGRRIVPYRGEGDRVLRGERIGMIRFGSRVDVILPHGVETGVRVGDRVRAGLTRLDLTAASRGG
jgi:phosphatidylserine decarboxylase